MPMGTRLSMSSVVRSVTGNGEHRQRERAGQRREMPHLDHHDLIDEQTDDDGGGAQQHIVDEPHHGTQARVPAVFREIGAGQHADGRTDQDAEQRHHRAAVQRIEQTALCARRRRHLGEQMPGQPRHTVRDQRPENRPETGQPRQGRHQGQRQECAVLDLAEGAPVHDSGRDPPLEAAQHRLGGRDHREGDDEQQHARVRSARRCT